MVGIYTTSPKQDQKRTRLRIKADLFLKTLQRNISTTAQLAAGAEWEHFFCTKYVLSFFMMVYVLIVGNERSAAATQYLGLLQSLAEAANAMQLGLAHIKFAPKNKTLTTHAALENSKFLLPNFLPSLTPGTITRYMLHT